MTAKAPAAATSATTPGLAGRVHELTLDNGFTILSVRRGTAPVFYGLLRFRVGSVDDPGGATGLAHLFEHLAFKGTSTIGTRDAKQEAVLLDALDDAARALNAELDRIGGPAPDRLAAARERLAAATKAHQAVVVRDEFSEILQSNGAAGLNASTGADVTTYYVGLPSNRLELWFLLESARLRDPVLRELYSERNVVLEERRFRLDTNPQGKLYEAMLGAAYQAHPYRVPGVGWASDLERVTRPQAEAFRRQHYVPANAIATLVGDVDQAEVERLARRYFAPIPSAPAAPPVGTVEPEQPGERRVEVEFDAEPQILVAFHKTAVSDPDDPVFEIIDGLLTSGRTGRLFRRLVIEEQVALGLGTFEAPGRRYPSLFVINAAPRAPHGVADVEKSLLAELDRLSAEPPTPAEMEKIRNQVRSDGVYALRSNAGLAEQLSLFEALTGDWRNLEKRQQALLAVTPEQVAEVARRTFTAKNRTV
ncbi:MAG TPA: pitrilysin family protein, partial [Candidatus Polarisedimenticolia bacterium]|nr:pitrilysin family protein [Candidatus Polarisedimenticolia bacterium]